jgi:ATP phosphoribosyltransferase regulatory subunit
MITFNDTDGKLLALKPDVTLSIIKNSVDGEPKRKVYYHENVYRISGNTKQFKEIPQAGVECIGEIGVYDVFESVYLAAKSLAAISENFILDISHLGIVFALLADIHAGEKFDKAVMRCLAEKNAPALSKLCQEEEISLENTQKLQTLLSAYGKMNEVLCKIKPVCFCGKAKLAYEALQELCSLLSTTEYADKYRLDFSVVNDMSYYSGIFFRGFVDGIPQGILSGGRYDKLMQKMGRKSGAIGFAVYLDMLERFDEHENDYDTDILLLYDDGADVCSLAEVFLICGNQRGFNRREQDVLVDSAFLRHSVQCAEEFNGIDAAVCHIGFPPEICSILTALLICRRVVLQILFGEFNQRAHDGHILLGEGQGFSAAANFNDAILQADQLALKNLGAVYGTIGFQFHLQALGALKITLALEGTVCTGRGDLHVIVGHILHQGLNCTMVGFQFVQRDAFRLFNVEAQEVAGGFLDQFHIHQFHILLQRNLLGNFFRFMHGHCFLCQGHSSLSNCWLTHETGLCSVLWCKNLLRDAVSH